MPTPTGLLKEMDAIVFGKYAIYLVDVKGYSGTLNVDANAFLDGRIATMCCPKWRCARIWRY